MNEKIRTQDDLVEIIVKLSEGNPGAMTCLTELARVAQRRPLIFAYGVIMFEALKLRGSSIYVLWNDCLYRSTDALGVLIDLWRNDAISSETILTHVNADGGRGLPLDIPKVVIFR